MSKSTFFKNFGNWGLIGLAGVLVLIVSVLSFSELTQREAGFLGTLLTFVSILSGGIVTHIYSKETSAIALADAAEYHQKNLRTYALNAAEKVTNLSKELNRLSTYLAEELEENDYRNIEQELLAKEERIQSAIHILQSLRSVNDTSLSDWRGVISEELEEKRFEDEERAKDLEQLLERLSQFEVIQQDTQRHINSVLVNGELKEIKSEIRKLTQDVTGLSFKRIAEKRYSEVSIPCPRCSVTVHYKQQLSKPNLKCLTCKSCSVDLVSEVLKDKQVVLRERLNLPERIVCGKCERNIDFNLDEWVGSFLEVACDCGETHKVSRSSAGIRTVKTINQKSKHVLTEDVLIAIKNALPEQPWPKGTHLVIAKSLNLEVPLVRKGMSHLIKTGIFKDQIDGQICTVEEKLKIMRESGQDI